MSERVRGYRTTRGDSHRGLAINRGPDALGASMKSTTLVGGRSAEDAIALVNYQVDRLFPGGRTAGG
ncbi:hypothetical protein KRM28CT15_68970 [Krasilnikovia sp. M28-CT-15]